MRMLKVQGKGHVATEPDMVTLSFDVEVDDFDCEKCLRILNQRTDDLRNSISTAEVTDAKLKTSSFNIRVKNEYEDGHCVFAGYSASHRMHIELPLDKQLLNQVLQQVTSGQSSAEINLSFSVRDKDSLRRRVLAQAVQTAKENAETLASAAGVKLGKLVQIDYGWAEVHVYDQMACMEGSLPCAPECDADIEPEDVRAEDNVTLVYEIKE